MLTGKVKLVQMWVETSQELSVILYAYNNTKKLSKLLGLYNLISLLN